MAARVAAVIPCKDEADRIAATVTAVASLPQVGRVVVVDDGSTDRTGEIADEWARRDARISVVHSVNGGLGAARNLGVQHVRGDYLAFLDSDDVLPPTAYADLVGALDHSGSDFATGSIVRWEGAALVEPPWMRRLHRPLRGARIEERPEILGDVFAWNKLYRRSWWDARALAWPEGVRYEDQPTTTRAFLTGTFDVLPDVVYHWRIREDGTSITQQRASLADLTDRWETKRMAWASVTEHGDDAVTAVFLDRVLAGDLWRYFLEIPTGSDAWWDLLRSGVLEFWGERSLVHSGLPPVHRLAGWLVEQGRRDEVTRLMRWVASLDAPVPRTRPRRGLFSKGAERLDVPAEVVDLSTVDPAAMALRPHELTLPR